MGIKTSTTLAAADKARAIAAIDKLAIEIASVGGPHNWDNRDTLGAGSYYGPLRGVATASVFFRLADLSTFASIQVAFDDARSLILTGDALDGLERFLPLATALSYGYDAQAQRFSVDAPRPTHSIL